MNNSSTAVFGAVYFASNSLAFASVGESRLATWPACPANLSELLRWIKWIIWLFPLLLRESGTTNLYSMW
ncbi:hypothetical protein ACRALDRAFT_207533 [Sodiomyces alcalophilus JCM 7366]|uniref:uncharacterized protein n=1 Tax=Sodiomyces alcalophilus JCM 7366 TaxID=591952 RepID=UPI0039B61EC2